MSVRSRTASSQVPRGLLRSVPFFVLFYLYLWLRVDPSLLYFWPSEVFPPFSLGWRFFRGFLGYPGGLVEYVSAFLSQLFYYPWAGAGVITAAAALVSAVTWVYVKLVTGTSARLVHFVPALLLLLMYNLYGHPLGMIVAVLVATAGACAYVLLRRIRWWLGLLAYAGLLLTVYYLAAGSVLLYAVLCGTAELLLSRGLVLSALYISLGAAAPFVVGTYVFGLAASEAYSRFLPFYASTRASDEVLGWCLYLFVPAVVWGAAFWQWASGASFARSGAPDPLSGQFGRYLQQRPLRWAASTPAFLVVAAAIAWLSFSKGLNAYLSLERCARLGMWPDLLQKARSIPRRQYDLLICYDVNRALWHSGQLLDQMFSYPQHPRGLLITPREMVETMGAAPFALMKFSDILFELGSVNEAEHIAHEVFSTIGNRPSVLQRLALIGMVKGQTGAARLHLWALNEDVVYGRWAKEQLRRLAANPELSEDAQAQRLRSFMPVKDDPTDTSVDGLLERLLERNGRNQMAFEYLIAYCLLNRRLDKLVGNLSRLKDLGYARIPRHCEEAILVYQAWTWREVRAPDGSVSPEVRERFRAFNEALASYGGDAKAAREALAKDFGGSYFFYYMFVPAEPSR